MAANSVDDANVKEEELGKTEDASTTADKTEDASTTADPDKAVTTTGLGDADEPHEQRRVSKRIKIVSVATFQEEAYDEEEVKEEPPAVKPPVVKKCGKCKFVYTLPASLDLHDEVVHAPKLPLYQCEKCDYCTSRSSDYNQHIFTHTKDRPYYCQHCNKAYPTSKTLNKHSQLVCEEPPLPAQLPVLKCEQCPFVYITAESLSMHQTVHRSKYIVYQCVMCEYVTARLSDFNVHIFKHTKDQPYYCETCRRAFTVVRSLQQHSCVFRRVRGPRGPKKNNKLENIYKCSKYKLVLKRKRK